jgi:hypothetical protein
VVPLIPFFQLTSTFFGLTSEFKQYLLEEIWICTQYMQNMPYSNVLNMPTHERRFYIGRLNRDSEIKQEQYEKMKEEQTNKNAKGSRSTKLSGDALKTKLKTGEIPIN